jgi:hypothetical protein
VNHTRIDDDLIVDESLVPDILKTRAQVLISIMRTKMEILDRIEIAFVERVFDDMDKAEKLLAEYNHGDIPDYLLKELSEKLYHRQMKELTDDEQTIIKTLSLYICISIQSSNKS